MRNLLCILLTISSIGHSVKVDANLGQIAPEPDKGTHGARMVHKSSGGRLAKSQWVQGLFRSPRRAMAKSQWVPSTYKAIDHRLAKSQWVPSTYKAIDRMKFSSLADRESLETTVDIGTGNDDGGIGAHAPGKAQDFIDAAAKSDVLAAAEVEKLKASDKEEVAAPEPEQHATDKDAATEPTRLCCQERKDKWAPKLGWSPKDWGASKVTYEDYKCPNPADLEGAWAAQQVSNPVLFCWKKGDLGKPTVDKCCAKPCSSEADCQDLGYSCWKVPDWDRFNYEKPGALPGICSYGSLHTEELK